MSLSNLLAQAHARIAARLNNDNVLSTCILFFSLCDGKERARIYRGAGSNFQEAWKQGVALCQREAQRHKLVVRWLRIDWVVSIEATTWGEFAARLAVTKRNYFRLGVALDAELRLAFLEQELSANAMLYPGSDKAEAGLNQKNFTVRAQRRFGQKVTLDFSPQSAVYLFSHEGLFLAKDPAVAALPAGGGPVWLPGPGTTDIHWREPNALNAGRRQIEHLTPKHVYLLIESSANFLARQVKKSGQFIYGHFPCFGRQIATYNSLRHASSVYSMLEGWELTRNKALLAASRRALAYLAGTLIRRYPQMDGSTLAYNVDVNGEIKLGANAVSLLAFVKYDELTGDTQYRSLMEELALGIKKMQDPSTGGFVHVLNSENLALKEAFRIVYYDGEAAFGLMRLYGLTSDERWLAIVERAFEYFIRTDHWRHHDHWLSYCANELTLYRPEEKYFRFGVQNIAGYLDFIRERETTYPTLLELSMAFDAMLRRINENHPEMQAVLDDLDIAKFYRALHHRAHHILNGFFWPELAMYFAKPSSVVGSFFIRHHTFRVRIDDIEHYLSGYVAYWKMLSRLEEKRRGSVDSIIDINSTPSTIKALQPAPTESGLVVAWGGDVNLGRRQHYRTVELGESNILRIPALKDADLRIINLECVVATQGEQGVRKGEGGPYYYRARPEMLGVLTAANIDVVTTANNHSGDYGPAALLEQATWLDAVGIAHVGTGAQKEAAFTPVLRRAGNLNVAVFSIDATQHRFAATNDTPGSAYLPLNDVVAWKAEMAPRIEEIRKQAHIVLVAVHWGDNLAVQPDADEITVGRGLIDAGADAVLGASAHVLQGIEIYRDRPIIHDAGDLLFDSMRRRLGTGGIFRLELDHNGVRRVAFVPVGIGFGFSEQLTGSAAQAATEEFARLCLAMGSTLTLTQDGCGHINLTPPPREFLKLAPVKSRGIDPSRVAAANNTVCARALGWEVEDIPEDARITPLKLGPLTLVGVRVSPTMPITQRQMLWVESFWRSDTLLEEDIRLDIRAVPVQATSMLPWGQSMDHDPCDWMMPTSRWRPGAVYRDYYGLRPPSLKDIVNVDLQLTVNVVARGRSFEPALLPFIIKLELPVKNQRSSAVETGAAVPVYRTYREDFPDVIYQVTSGKTWNSEQLEAVTGGEWLVRPPDDWFIRSLVASSAHVDMLPEPVMYVAHTHMDRAKHEQYSDMSKVHANNWDSHSRLKGLHTKLAGAIVNRPVAGLPYGFPLLRVDDPFKALLELGAANRRRIKKPVVAVTGSAGKTSTVHMLRKVFGEAMRVHATYDNYNSRCGALIVLASAPPDVELVVIEVGVGGAVESAGLAHNMGLVAPDITVITNVGTSHLLAGQTTLDTARKKSNLFRKMKPGSTAVICRDTEHFEFIAERAAAARLSLLTYGEHPESHIRLAGYWPDDGRVSAIVFGKTISYRLSVPGKHMALNSLVCLAVAEISGIKLDLLYDGFKKISAVVGRGVITDTVIDSMHVRVVDESYNANPLSMHASLEMFASMKVASHTRKILVLGDMLELGDEAEVHHDQLLGHVVACKPSRIFLVGKLITRLKDGLLEEGIMCNTYENTDGVLPELRGSLRNNDIVFFKSSNGVGLHRIVRELKTLSRAVEG